MHLAQMETPKSTGIGQNRFAHSQNASHYFSPRGPISSPLATSSPMFPIVGSADRPQHRPPLKPKQPPFSTHPQIAVHHNIIAAGPGPGSDVMSQQRQQQHMASRTNTIRSADLSSIFTMPEEMNYGIRHQELLDLIAAQKNQIEQAAAAIAFCRKKYSYNGTLQELSAQRLLLVSQERLALYNRQLDQLKDHHLAPNKFHRNLEDIPESVDFESLDAEDMGAASVAGLTSINEQNLLYNLFIDKFVLQLNPSFSMKKIDKEASYAFIVLCRYEGCIHATQVANVLDIGELRNNKVKFKELVIFDDLPPDFCVLVEVFAMKIGKRWDHKWQSVWDFAARTFRNLKRTFTYSSGIGTISAGNSGKAGGGNGTVPAPAPSFSASSVLSQQQTMISSEFRRCGYLHLTRDSLALGKEKFFLSDADYPLEGSVEVFARFAASNSPMEPPRPDSASIDLRMGMGGSSMVGGSGL